MLQGGNIAVTQPPHAAICVRAPADAPRIPTRDRRGYRDEQDFAQRGRFPRATWPRSAASTPERNRAACFAFAPDLPPFEESDDERLMRAFCELARNAEGCHRYALLMEQHPDGCRPRRSATANSPVNAATPRPVASHGMTTPSVVACGTFPARFRWRTLHECAFSGLCPSLPGSCAVGRCDYWVSKTHAAAAACDDSHAARGAS